MLHTHTGTVFLTDIKSNHTQHKRKHKNTHSITKYNIANNRLYCIYTSRHSNLYQLHTTLYNIRLYTRTIHTLTHTITILLYMYSF